MHEKTEHRNPAEEEWGAADRLCQKTEPKGKIQISKCNLPANFGVVLLHPPPPQPLPFLLLLLTSNFLFLINPDSLRRSPLPCTSSAALRL